MRIFYSLLFGLVLSLSVPARAQQAVINVEESSLSRTRQTAHSMSADYIPPADGGLGSTMTLAQQGQISASIRAEENKTLTVQPAGEPSPSLKYRLWTPDFTLRPGSALLHFSRAILMWTQFPVEFRNKLDRWNADGQIPEQEELGKAIDSLSNVFKELHLLATSEERRFDHRLRDISGPNLYAYLMPDIQESRALARLLRFKIQHQLMQHDVAGAVESLQDGFRLAAFVGQGETLIQQLVGMAIEGIMFEQVEQLIQTPGSPNMYWALATLPRPLVEVNDSIQFELSSIHRVIPALTEANAETDDRGEAYWNAAWAKVVDDLKTLGLDDQETKLAFAMLGVAAVGPAKQRLIESGLSAEMVEAMPAMRAVLLDASREIRRVSDDLAKANFLPNPLANKLVAEAQENLNAWFRENTFKSGGAAMLGLLLPAVQAARAAGIRQEFSVNRLMTIEALRMHSYKHDGALPASLEQLDPVPALPNPFTGKAFDYQMQFQNGEYSAVLTADVPAPAKHLKEVTIRFGKQ